MNTFKTISSRDLKITGDKCHFTFDLIKGSVRWNWDLNTYLVELFVCGDVALKETTNFSKINKLLIKVNNMIKKG